MEIGLKLQCDLTRFDIYGDKAHIKQCEEADRFHCELPEACGYGDVKTVAKEHNDLIGYGIHKLDEGVREGARTCLQSMGTYLERCKYDGQIEKESSQPYSSRRGSSFGGNGDGF